MCHLTLFDQKELVPHISTDTNMHANHSLNDKTDINHIHKLKHISHFLPKIVQKEKPYPNIYHGDFMSEMQSKEL